jgi:hypothetical protein
MSTGAGAAGTGSGAVAGSTTAAYACGSAAAWGWVSGKGTEAELPVRPVSGAALVVTGALAGTCHPPREPSTAIAPASAYVRARACRVPEPGHGR